jgi:hypothetical protein
MADFEEASYTHEEDEEQLWCGEFCYRGSYNRKNEGHGMTDMIDLL